MALNVDFQGVWTNPNAHSKVPAGAARRAENLVNPRPGVASTVPGMENMEDAYSASDERFSSGISYQGCLIESTSGATPKLYVRDLDADTLTAESGSFSPPSGVARIPFVVAGEKVYMLTSDGVEVKDGVAAAPAGVGVPAPINSQQVGKVNVGSGTFTTASGAQIAYRWVHVRHDSAGIRMDSAPSGRIVFTADVSPQSYDVTLILNLHSEIVAGDEIWLYRTGFSDLAVDPGDVMSLIQVHEITGAEVTATTVQLTDNTPDELRGEALYTNATAESIVRQNERPPYAKVISTFDDFLIMGDVRGPQRFQFRLLAPIQAGDVLTIAGQTYTAKVYTDPTDPDYTNGEFETTTGMPTVSENIYFTALALIDAINRTTANTSVYASYVSGQNDAPGIIQIEARTAAVSAFTVQASANGENYEPPLTSAQVSLATTEPNGIWLSKRGKHYAFPPLRSSTATYRFRVGVKGNPILAMVPLRESLIVFVSQEGVWRVQRSGAESWRVDQINNNAHLLVPDSVAVVDNRVIALTTRGVIAVDSGGVEEIDIPIKDQIDAMRSLGPDVVVPCTFGIGDEARLRYILYHPEEVTDDYATHAWVYNAEEGTWTERTDPATGGLVGEDDGLLYLGSATSNVLTRERTGTATQVYKRPDNTAIPVRLEWTVMDEGDPGAEKQFTELRLLTKDAINGDVTFTCTNDLGGTDSTTGSTSSAVAGEPFVNAWVPDGCQRTTRLKVDIQRDVFEQAFEVVGMKTITSDMYDGGMLR